MHDCVKILHVKYQCVYFTGSWVMRDSCGKPGNLFCGFKLVVNAIVLRHLGIHFTASWVVRDSCTKPGYLFEGLHIVVISSILQYPISCIYFTGSWVVQDSCGKPGYLFYRFQTEVNSFFFGFWVHILWVHGSRGARARNLVIYLWVPNVAPMYIALYIARYIIAVMHTRPYACLFSRPST